jgi:hypothetical protein
MMTIRPVKLLSRTECECSAPRLSSYAVEITPRYNNAEGVTSLATTLTRPAANYRKEQSSVTDAEEATTAETTIMSVMRERTKWSENVTALSNASYARR